MSGDHAIVVADLQGLIQHWDATAERYFGFSAAEALGESLDLHGTGEEGGGPI